MIKDEMLRCKFGLILFDGGFKELKDISLENYQRYESAVTYIENFCEEEQLIFSTVESNYKELQKTVNDYVRDMPRAYLYELKNYLNNPFLPKDLQQKIRSLLHDKKLPKISKNKRTLKDFHKSSKIDFNRRLMNFLTSFRVYIKQSEMKFKCEFGRKSPELEHYLLNIKKIREENFSFRFIMQLRNFVSYLNLPLASIGYHSIITLPKDKKNQDLDFLETMEQLSRQGQMRHELKVTVDRDKLLNASYSWDSKTLVGIQKMPESIDLRPYLDEAIRCLAVIHSLRLFYKVKGISASLNTIEDYTMLYEPFVNLGTPSFIIDHQNGFSCIPLRTDLYDMVNKAGKKSSNYIYKYEPKKKCKKNKHTPYYNLRTDKQRKIYKWVKVSHPPLPKI